MRAVAAPRSRWTGINFLQPVSIGDEASLYAEVERVGRTSMTIHVEAWRRARGGDARQRVTDATFVFLALDTEGRPRVVPSVTEAS